MQPKLTVVMAVYNEEKLIAHILQALQKQTVKDEVEVLIVDNGSKDRTSEIAKEYGATVLPYTEIQGCGPARSYGVSKAQAPLVAFLDADSIVNAHWAEKVIKKFDEPKLMLLGARPMPDKHNFMINAVFWFYDWFTILNIWFGKPVLWGFTLAFRKEAYDKIGGINTKLLSSDDWDLCIRMRRKFGSQGVQYVRTIQVITQTRKQQSVRNLLQYTKDGGRNYIDLVLFGKIRAIPVFNVR